MPGEQPGGSGPWGVFSRAFDRGFGWLEQRYEASCAGRWPPLAAAAGGHGPARRRDRPGPARLGPQRVPAAGRRRRDDRAWSSCRPARRCWRPIRRCAWSRRELDQIPEVEYYMSTSGIEQPGQSADWSTDATARFGNVNVGLVDPHHRHRSISAVMAGPAPSACRTIPDAKITVQIASATGSSPRPSRSACAAGRRDRWSSLADKVAEIVQQTPGAVDVDSDGSRATPRRASVPVAPVLAAGRRRRRSTPARCCRR